MNLVDYAQNSIRLTDERLDHIKEHPEMIMHIEKIAETLQVLILLLNQKPIKKQGFTSGTMRVFL